jgi:TonB-linked SusC/RagA family outer membrane protein
MKQKLLIILMTLFSHVVWAQDFTVRGKVSSQDDNMGIPGASIIVKGTSTGTVTDIDGNYNITIPANATLLCSFVGMETQEVVVAGRSQINIILQTSTTGLEEVMVVGYGVQTKKDITGSIVGIKGDELKNVTSLSPMQSIQGKLAGVQIVNSSAPGSAPTIRIRGAGTMKGGADPLYVVDGIITGDVRNINQADIVSVDILKDASSASIYGVRGANGVIIITTKSGTKGKMEVNLSSKVGVHSIINDVKMANSKLFADYSNEAAAYDNQEAPYDLSKIKSNTDWMDAITRQSYTQEHNLSINGGSDKNTYYFSLGYMEDQGILKSNDYSRLSIRMNNTYKLSDKVKVGNNLSISRYKSNNAPYSAFTDAYRQSPTVPIRDEDGEYGFSIRNNVGNPVASLDYNNSEAWGTRIQGSVFAELTPLKGLSFKSTVSVDASYSKDRSYTPVYEVSSNQKSENSSLSTGRGEYATWIWDNILSYSFKIDEKHDFKLMAGTTAEKTETTWLNGSRQNIPEQSQYWYLNAGDVETASNGNSGDIFSRNSYLGRLNYAFDNKYLLTATLRRDGSSKISLDERWGTFPSVGLGWRISEESFMQDIQWLDNLKLRTSWGKLGNDNIPSGAFIVNMYNADYVFGDTQAYTAGRNVDSIKDLGLKWEVTTEYDLGLEFSFLNNKITGEIDYYNKLTTDALIDAPIDNIFGKGAILTNKADIRNQGFEIALNWREKINSDLNFTVGVNLTHNKNSLENIAGGLPITSGDLGNGQVTTRTAEGEELGSFWVFQTDGIFQSQGDIDAYTNEDGGKIQADAKPGDFRLKDSNGDGKLDDEDREYMGSYQPKFYYGLNAAVNYKNLDFQIDFYGNAGNKIYNGKKAQRWGNENIEASLAGRWTAENPSNTIPRASNNVPVASSYYVESGSYIKISNITLGYSLPKTWLNTVGLEKVRCYMTAVNPVIWQDYSGYTPELPGGTLNSGIELNAYPTAATYLLGVNITF